MTDAPFRETETAIDRARAEEITVETEPAALYTFVNERNQSVVCFAYVTNEMERGDSEFEQGDADGRKALEMRIPRQYDQTRERC